MKSISTIARYRVEMPERYLGLLEHTHDRLRIRGTLYSRFTFRGVPGRETDVIVADSIMEHAVGNRDIVLEVSQQRPAALPEACREILLEVGEKAGRYDGQVRRRYALRPFPGGQGIPSADLRIVREEPGGQAEGRLMVIIRPRGAGAPIVDEFRVLRGELDGYRLSRIVGWHWRKWFTHLTDADEVRAFADSWEAEVRATGEAASWTLAEANRAASRALYRLSRQSGWRKLTQRERDSLGYPAGAAQWQREADVVRRLTERGEYSATGCGEGTLTAARTGHWPVHFDPPDSDPSDADLIEAEFDSA